MTPTRNPNTIRAGMVGVGMIFEDTYWPFFQQALDEPLYSRATGPVEVELAAMASRTGARAETYLRQRAEQGRPAPLNCTGPSAMASLLEAGVDAVCIATPDDRHFDLAKAALSAGKHVLIEKPSVLRLDQLAQPTPRTGEAAEERRVHRLIDPEREHPDILEARHQPIWCNPRTENAAGEAADPVSSHRDHGV